MYFDNEIKFVYFKLLLHIQDNLNKNKPHKTTSSVIRFEISYAVCCASVRF